MWPICEKMFIFAPVVPQKRTANMRRIVQSFLYHHIRARVSKMSKPIERGCAWIAWHNSFQCGFAVWWGRGRVVEICTFSISMKIRKGFRPMKMENQRCVAINIKRMWVDSGCTAMVIRRGGHLVPLQCCCAYRPVGPSSRRNETKFSKQSALAVDKHLRDNQHQSTGRSR